MDTTTNQTVGTTAKDFFLHLGILVTLHVTIISFLVLVFSIINKFIADPLNSYYYGGGSFEDGSIRTAIAVLVIAFPIHAVLMWLIEKDIARIPEKAGIWVKRWFSYLVLFIAGATLAGDLMFLINNFLQGELTGRFLLKALAVLIVVGVVFVHYIWSLKATSDRFKYTLWHIIAVSVVVLAAIVVGFIQVGLPASQRLVRLDQIRTNDLSTIQGQVLNYWQLKEEIPASLDVLTADTLSGFKLPVDPETGAAYEYRKVGDNAFELCATFKAASDATEANDMYSMVYDGGFGNFEHGVGRTCFTRTIDPELYPPFSKR